MHEPPTSLSRAAIALLTVAAVVVVAAGAALVLATRPQPVEITIYPPAPTATPPPTLTPAPMTIYVTGAVASPGTLVTLPRGSRVQDAIAAAGGAGAGGDLTRVNLASLLRDGDHVHVPAVGEGDRPLPTASGGGIVNVNTATLDELTTLPGIGPVTAQAILDYREANGPFADLNALEAVDGIGPRTLERLDGLVEFE